MLGEDAKWAESKLVHCRWSMGRIAVPETYTGCKDLQLHPSPSGASVPGPRDIFHGEWTARESASRYNRLAIRVLLYVSRANNTPRGRHKGGDQLPSLCSGITPTATGRLFRHVRTAVASSVIMPPLPARPAAGPVAGSTGTPSASSRLNSAVWTLLA